MSIEQLIQSFSDRGYTVELAAPKGFVTAIIRSGRVIEWECDGYSVAEALAKAHAEMEASYAAEAALEIQSE